MSRTLRNEWALAALVDGRFTFLEIEGVAYVLTDRNGIDSIVTFEGSAAVFELPPGRIRPPDYTQDRAACKQAFDELARRDPAFRARFEKALVSRGAFLDLNAACECMLGAAGL